ncbi:cyanophycinase [Pontibacter litorisediminis]|uniref:cyanophycinase n=1 Tax=Pontibacter litorisediminis TaxID=1846260 RepID=UPI0023EAD7C8|nr:cyanophycinase [Pontibacter litorisediminis]
MKTPKGKIVAIGGNEDKGTAPTPEAVELQQPSRSFDHGILRRIHDELYGPGTRIEVITTATRFPDVVGKIYIDAFLKLGCDNVGVLPIQEPADAAKPDYLERLRTANCIMLSGGDQVLLPRVLSGTEALHVIRSRYEQEEKFLISGTSAGAMALSGMMINGSLERDPLLKGTVHLMPGLDLLDQIIIDTHFVNRRRIPRLIEAVAAMPTHIGIGLGEDTAILIRQNSYIETIGSGLVIIIDGRHVLKNNFQQIHAGEALCVENLILHVLPKGQQYQLDSGEFKPR